MTLKLRTRLVITHLCTALLTVLFFTVTAGLFTGFLFEKYADVTQARKTAALVRSLEDQYQESGWQKEEIVKIGVQGLSYGFITKVRDAGDKVVWDALEHDREACQQTLRHISHSMRRFLSGWEGEYTTKTYPLSKGGKEIGTLEVGFMGPYFLTELELNYLGPLNKILAVLALVCIIAALTLSRWVNKGLTKELDKINRLAGLVAQKKSYDPLLFTSSSEEIRKALDNIKQLGQTLEEQEQVKKRMTADLAHELRTPLTTLQANLEGLLEGIWQPTKERLSSCHEEILRIIRLVGDLEQLTKFESDQMKLNGATFDLGELAGNICLNFQGAYRQKGVVLEFVGKKEMMTGDRDKISQLVVNLLSNSLKHTSTGGKVILVSSSNKDFIYLVLNDSGSGIPPEDLTRVFDRLYRADISRTRATGGSGIGLAIARAIVEAHHGSINIVSQVGTGTEVTVVLPRNYLKDKTMESEV
ncbi:MAG: ATP-binding protein [Clostridia bacterium]|nr:ATP-binding protein [Clostridia bacterium]